jgi:hypothetical protein
MSRNAREELVAAQVNLLRALQGSRSPPETFDLEQLETAAAALRSKRMRELEKAWPGLAQALGHQFRRLFFRYATEKEPLGNSGDDARQFARWLESNGPLPDDARLEVAAHAVARGIPIRLLFLRTNRRLALILRLPGNRVRCFGVRRGAR